MIPHLSAIILVVVASAFASTPPPFASETRVVDSIFELIRSGTEAKAPLLLLEHIAIGWVGSKEDGEALLKMGLSPAFVDKANFREAEVRVHALQMIGKTRRQDALDFLIELKRVDFGLDQTQRVWPWAQVVLHESEMYRLVEPQDKRLFLEASLTEGGLVAWWAANELCDRGSQTSLPLIRESIRKRDPFESGSDEYNYCQQRVEVLSRNLSRDVSLKSVLQSYQSDRPNIRLIGWAVDQLSAMNTVDAENGLLRFSIDIGKLPEGSEAKRLLETFREQILSGAGRRSAAQPEKK